MNIAGIRLKNPVAVAPMAGVTDRVFRKICKEMGAALVYTEMVSAKALCYQDKKTAGLMRAEQEEQPVGVQIFGSEPEMMAQGAKIVEASGNAALIDINMGCPVPKVAGNGEGSALMKNPALAGKIIESVARAVRLPVTVKIRSGWDENSVNAVEIAKLAQECGAAAVAVHGRTRQQFYSGKADWQIIRQVKESISLPVFGNGDILHYEDGARMMQETGCDGVLLARGLMGNPWLVAQCIEYMETGAVPAAPSVCERIEMALRHTRALADDKGESRGIKEARAHLMWYVKGLRGAARVKERLARVQSVAQAEEILYAWVDSMADMEEG